ncbi:MAG: RluA family pseudouridine synthase [Desulfuromonadales bacterium]
MAGRRKETLSTGPGERGERLDLFIARSLEGVSRKAVKRALDGGQVFVDGKVVRRAGYSLSGNDTITLTLDLPAPESSPPLPDILLWDADLLAINKPPGLSSHPTVAGRANALDLVRSFLRDRGKDDSPILLHRLDADTSGVLLFALTVAANRDLYRQLAGREVEKTYLCLVAGSPPDAFGVENHLKSGVRSRTVAVQSGGQKAVTEFRTLKRGQGFTLVEARPHTGRTHQIRVHLAGKGFPLLGDRLYGGPVAITLGGGTLPVRRHLLHAFRLAFRYPGTGECKVIEAPVPEDFKPFLPI